jgi:hypothetical protein
LDPDLFSSRIYVLHLAGHHPETLPPSLKPNTGNSIYSCSHFKGMISSPAFVFMMFLAMFAGPNASIRVHLMDSPLGF